jgi:hypothetical protein
MKFGIGQRRQLSEIDVAQLRAMYYCNKKDQRDKVCREGWNKFEDDCFKFVHDQQKSYRSARKYCENEGGHLAHITTIEVDDFIKGYLINFYPEVRTWRTGGKQENGNFVWFYGSGKPSKSMNYTKWAPNWPKKYTTHILDKFDGTPPRFVWKAAWAGSDERQVDVYPFICQATQNSKHCIHLIIL